MHRERERERDEIIMDATQDDFYLCFVPSRPKYVNKKIRGIYKLDFLKALKMKYPT
jgi:hypothetical protein